MQKAEPAHWPHRPIFFSANLFQTVSFTWFRFQTEKMFRLPFTRPPPSRSLNRPPSQDRRQCLTQSCHCDFSLSAMNFHASEDPCICSYHALNVKRWNIKTEKKRFSVSGSFFFFFKEKRSSWIYLLKFNFSDSFHPCEPVVLIFSLTAF